MRIGRRILLVVAVAVVAVAGWAAPAFAHAQLLSTNPGAGTVLPKSPGVVVLHFGEDVEIQFGAVHVYNSASQRIDDGNSYHPNGDGHSVAVKIPSKLAAGGYVVTWRVISADSHPVHGAFTFLIGSGGAGAATAATSQATRLLAATGGSVTVGVVFGADRFLAFAALFVLVGGTAFVVGAWPEGRDDDRARWLLLAGLVGAVVTTLAAIALQGPYGGGLPLLKALSPTVFREVLKTRFGEVYLARLVVLLAVAAPLMWRLRRPGALPRWWKPAGIVTGAAILITPGLAGHAATGSLIILAIPFDLIHVSAAAVWVGGLCVLAVAVLGPRKDRTGPNPLKTVLPRYSQWALVAVAAIAVSGGFAAWRQIGSLDAVTTTTYGRLVLAKTIIFLILVGIATKSRRIVHRGNLARAVRAVPVPRGARVPASPAPAASAPVPPSPTPRPTGPIPDETMGSPAGDPGAGDGVTTPAGVTPAGVTPADVTPAGVTPAGATRAGVTPAGVTPAGVTPAGATRAGVTSADVTPAGAADTPADTAGASAPVTTPARNGDRESTRRTPYRLRPYRLRLPRRYPRQRHPRRLRPDRLRPYRLRPSPRHPRRRYPSQRHARRRYPSQRHPGLAQPTRTRQKAAARRRRSDLPAIPSRVASGEKTAVGVPDEPRSPGPGAMAAPARCAGTDPATWNALRPATPTCAGAAAAGARSRSAEGGRAGGAVRRRDPRPDGGVGERPAGPPGPGPAVLHRGPRGAQRAGRPGGPTGQGGTGCHPRVHLERRRRATRRRLH